MLGLTLCLYIVMLASLTCGGGVGRGGGDCLTRCICFVFEQNYQVLM